MSTRMRRSSVLEQAEAQTAGVKRNAIKKQERNLMHFKTAQKPQLKIEVNQLQ